eukprot:TRINITY_DN38142_c0_g2_i1.p1 TRINITY_DN38142_c0_g2~~TRINITY_DN38142_c0_g2_i1.p1  ORF type:complete len:648 (-),score=101.26 TRINITY_DN38142_c0_g2_i1:68-1963(-)
MEALEASPLTHCVEGTAVEVRIDRKQFDVYVAYNQSCKDGAGKGTEKSKHPRRMSPIQNEARACIKEWPEIVFVDDDEAYCADDEKGMRLDGDDDDEDYQQGAYIRKALADSLQKNQSARQTDPSSWVVGRPQPLNLRSNPKVARSRTRVSLCNVRVGAAALTASLVLCCLSFLSRRLDWTELARSGLQRPSQLSKPLVDSMAHGVVFGERGVGAAGSVSQSSNLIAVSAPQAQPPSTPTALPRDTPQRLRTGLSLRHSTTQPPPSRPSSASVPKTHEMPGLQAVNIVVAINATAKTVEHPDLTLRPLPRHPDRPSLSTQTHRAWQDNSTKFPAQLLFTSPLQTPHQRPTAQLFSRTAPVDITEPPGLTFRVFLVNLDRRYDRLQRFAKRLEVSGVADILSPRLCRVPAVDGSRQDQMQRLVQEHIVEQRKMDEAQSNLRTGNVWNRITPGGIGNYASHLDALRLIANNRSLDFGVVIEDDVIFFSDDFRSRFEELWLPEHGALKVWRKADYIWLQHDGGGWPKGGFRDESLGTRLVDFRGTWPKNLSLYAISRRAAKRLLQRLVPIKNAIDMIVPGISSVHQWGFLPPIAQGVLAQQDGNDTDIWATNVVPDEGEARKPVSIQGRILHDC